MPSFVFPPPTHLRNVLEHHLMNFLGISMRAFHGGYVDAVGLTGPRVREKVQEKIEFLHSST